ncbi:hypothetical protein KC571_01605 [candidate division WWE3 bacterium]|uniref:Uncharacterized protein n=1 Tax=candidate division WWE3 bacterium TaxID=2053526 RepID=A0A955RPZ3_UNCKA|nr:hypothetical protein [candidate division WWE3 bacterium]
MKMQLLPNTKLGWWSVGLILAMFVLFTLGFTLPDTLYAGVQSGKTMLEDFEARPALALTMFAGMGFGIAACITGCWGIYRKKERSWLVFVSTLLGFGLILLFIGEILFPH